MKKILSYVMAAIMIFSLIPNAALAAPADEAAQGYTMSITMNKDGKQSASMCDAMFAQKADVSISGDTATVKIYVAYPVPAFANQGTDGTLKSFRVSYKGTEYAAQSDISTKPMMTVKADNFLFGLKQGEQIPAQIMTLELPKDALEENSLDVTAFVNVVMNSDVAFDMAISDLTPNETKPEPEPQPEQPQSEQNTVTVTMNKDGAQEPSMCDVMFAEKAGVEVNGDKATLKLYVAFPIPAFATEGKDGTLKDFVVTYQGKEYTAKSDIDSKPMMTVKADNEGFGLKKGEKITAQVLTVELPKEALKEAFLDVRAFVNVFMMMPVDFDMALSDLKLPEPEPEKITAAPAVEPNGGSFRENQSVTLSCQTENAVIYYTTDGTEPTDQSNRYTGPFTLTETAVVKAMAVAEGMKLSEVTVAEFTKEAGGEEPAPEAGKIEDGTYHVDIALWHETADRASMGDAAFASSRQAVVKVADGKVTTVQVTSGPVQMGPITSAITYVTTDGQEVQILKTEKLTISDGTEIDYIKQFAFQMPDGAQPESLAGVTYVPVQFKVPGTPMGDTLMNARLKMDWSSAEKIKDGETVEPTEPETPKPELTEMDFTDQATGIKVHADKGVFTEPVTLHVTAITSGKDYTDAAKSLSGVGRKFKLFEIHFENEAGAEVQPNGAVTVSYKIPDGYDAAKLELYRINPDGTKTLVSGSVKDGYFEAIQKHFSTYALVEKGSKTSGNNPGQKPGKPGSPNTGDEAPILTLGVMTAVSAAAAVLLLADRKRRNAK